MNLNGRVFNPGEMRKRVTLQSRSVTAGTGGFQTKAWSTIAVVWAKWVNVHGSESVQAAAMGIEELATVTVRYRSGIDPTCAILKGSTRYEIISIDNIGERNEFLEIKVKRMRAG